MLDGIHCRKCFFHTTFQEFNLLPSSGESLSLERQVLLIFFIFSSLAVTGIRTCKLFRSSVLWITSLELSPLDPLVVLMTNPDLKTGVDSTPETWENTLDNGFCPTNLCYKSNTIVTNLSSFLQSLISLIYSALKKTTVFGQKLLLSFLSTLCGPDDANHAVSISAILSPLSYLLSLEPGFPCTIKS